MRVLLVAACSLTLSFGAAIGINLQKLSMNKEETKPTKRPVYLQPLWCIGMAILVVDACGDFVFIGLAPQSLLAPLGALSLGFNIILAPIFHPKEQVTRNIVGATALIYVGTILTILYAADSTPTYNLQKLLGFCTTPLFLCYAMACITFQMALAHHGRRSKNSFSLVHYCGLAGCFGGESILLAKSASELVKNALVNGQYEDWTTSIVPYLFVAGMICTVLTQVNLLNTGLAKFDALIVVPVYQSFWNAFGITGGLVFFQEYQYMNQRDGIMYAIGIGITLIGVVLLVQERRRGDSNKQQQQQDHQPLMTAPVRNVAAEEEGTMRQRRGARHNNDEVDAV